MLQEFKQAITDDQEKDQGQTDKTKIRKKKLLNSKNNFLK